MAIQEYKLKLLQTTLLNNRVKHFIGQIESSDPWHYTPGQFITISFTHQDKILRRSYSIANSPQMNNIIEFAASFVEHGPGSEYLFSLKPNDLIRISGPFGRLTIKDTERPQRYILMATNTGVTPYRAMLNQLEHLLSQDPSLELVIILGVQKADEILFEADFQNFCQNNPRAKFIACLSQETCSHHPNHLCGRVQKGLEQIHPNSAKDMVYLCGNPQMIDESTELLKNMGFPIQKIIREKYL